MVFSYANNSLSKHLLITSVRRTDFLLYLYTYKFNLALAKYPTRFSVHSESVVGVSFTMRLANLTYYTLY